jgi:hypothetical protein
LAHDVFISYGTEDKPVADAVCARLESRGIRCWIAPRDVQPGRSYGECIAEALHECRALVLVFSANANLSRHVSNEVERAVHNNLTVIPFRIEEVMPSPALEFFIGSVHWLDAITEPLEQHLDVLADSVERLTSGRTIPIRRRGAGGSSWTGSQRRMLLAAGLVVVLLAVIAYLLLNRGTPANSAPVPGAAIPVGSPTLAGCWIYNTARMTMANDGQVIGPLEARWTHSGGNQYVITWPATAETLTLAPDGRSAAGSNNFTGPGVTAQRLAGGPGQFIGSWLWPNGLTVLIRPGGDASAGTLTGRWSQLGPGTFRVTWNFIPVDQLVLSPDGATVKGQNNLAQPVGGTRVPCN